MSALLEKLLVGHCKGYTHSGVFKSHVFAANWATAGDADFLSSFYLDTKAINFPTAFCGSPSLCQPCLSWKSRSLGWHKCLYNSDRSEQPLELGGNKACMKKKKRFILTWISSSILCSTLSGVSKEKTQKESEEQMMCETTA